MGIIGCKVETWRNWWKVSADFQEQKADSGSLFRNLDNFDFKIECGDTKAELGVCYTDPRFHMCRPGPALRYSAVTEFFGSTFPLHWWWSIFFVSNIKRMRHILFCRAISNNGAKSKNISISSYWSQNKTQFKIFTLGLWKQYRLMFIRRFNCLYLPNGCCSVSKWSWRLDAYITRHPCLERFA